MSEFQINGHTYRAGKMNAKRQMHVMRRVAPVLPNVAGLATIFSGRDPGSVTLMELSPALSPIANAISHMSDDDCEYVLDACLSVVQRQQAQSWAPLWNQAAGAPQFADVELPAMLQIASRVLQENFAGFLGGLPSVSASPPTAEAGAIG